MALTHDEIMIDSFARQTLYFGHHKTKVEEGDQSHMGERSGERNMDWITEYKYSWKKMEAAVQSTRQRWMVINGIWSVFHWERQVYYKCMQRIGFISLRYILTEWAKICTIFSLQ